MANWRNTAERWGNIARILHWTIAVLIIGVFTAGLIMEDMANGPDKYWTFMMHKSFGLLVILLVICRLVWRLTNRKPRNLASIPWHMNVAAEITHWALYALMLAIPFSGWLVHSYANFPLNWFGIQGLAVPRLASLPASMGSDEVHELVENTGELHGALAWLLMIVVAVHVAAALYHHFIRKDAVLARMTPFIREPKGS